VRSARDVFNPLPIMVIANVMGGARRRPRAVKNAVETAWSKGSAFDVGEDSTRSGEASWRRSPG